MTRKPNLLITKKFHPDSLAYIKKELNQYFTIIVPSSFSESNLTPYIPDAEYILGHHLPDSLLLLADKLKYFQSVSSGLDHLNLSLFNRLNIAIGNSTSHAPYVAKFALSLMLNIACKISLNDKIVRSAFNHSSSFPVDPKIRLSPSLFGEHIGLIGYGAINQYLEKLLAPFDVKILYNRKSQDSNSSSLDQIFSVCRFIFIALPLNSLTKGLINHKHLVHNLISPYIVNVGRAEVIDFGSLIKALDLSTISGFATDVAYGENTSSPFGFDGLYQYSNVILSPHRASSTEGIPSYLPGAIANLSQIRNSSISK